ncbi:APC family permease [Streptococcus anginosus]|uniref:Amino acid permease n=1 Tax=Streptococcus anginosus SK1138 TaxID=1161422 RepID=A0AAD2T9K5_STRAP|nr:APC family permease [Streptococcus anginosus]EJP27225.1 amino acid permease [Streptococcus anginosus SK1138]MCY7224047.1 APC family permease [Streptococcus anginosus]PRT76939.1 APC family permease [Streptococcus anginosus]RIB36367.1 APC family permease [Streptococcus anginosus]
MFSKLKNIFIGRPLKSSDEGDEGNLLTKLQALAMLSSDALSSIAYGPEQVVLVLVSVSAGAIWWSLPIGIVVLILLASLTISYRQVIHAYPQGGGAYMVTTENLSPKAGLVSGGSLLVDYMLTVAVSVSSGADAITSAIPALHPYNLHISIILVLVLMLMNLRGLRESAVSLMIPVYLFIASTVFLIGFGLLQLLLGNLSYHATAPIGKSISGVSLVLLLRAFTSGSASLTGVEAISNSVPFFKTPKAENAAKTLAIMAAILGFMFAGITFLNYWIGIVPVKGVTTLAQMAQAILGNSPVGRLLFYIFQLSTALILAVAANTGFSAFPMLSYNMAKNKYMPHMYMEKGARLGYSNGILTLAIGAILLLLIFNGNTERLIPLYTIGVFVPFALSQTGMVVHWHKQYGKHFLKYSMANILGAAICYTIVAILLLFRLRDIWPFFPIIIVLLWIFLSIKNHYNKVAKQLRLNEEIERVDYAGNLVLVLVGNVTRVSVGAMNYARSIGDEVIAMHVSTKETQEKDEEVASEFKQYFPDIQFVNVETSYRNIIRPTVQYVTKIARGAQKKGYTVTVLVPQFIPNHSWQNMLHNQMSLKLKYFLRWHENVVVASYSYHLKE